MRNPKHIKKILIHPNSTHIDDFIILANQLSKNFEVFFFNWNKSLSLHKKRLKKDIKIITYNNPIYWNISEYLKNYSSISIFKKSFLFIKDYFCIKKIYQQNRFDMLLANSDRDTSILLNLCKQAKSTKSKVILNCNSRCADIETLVYRRINNRGFKFVKGNIFTKYFKNQFIKFSNDNLISFYPLNELFLFEVLKLLPENPWVIGGGNSDYVFVENKNIKKYFINLKCRTKKLISIGSNNSDILHSEIKIDELKKKLKLKNNSKILILLLSHFYEHGDLSYKEHKSHILEICSFLNKIKKEGRFQILISLHPKQKYKNYKWIENELKIKISKFKLSEIIKIGDMIISELPSAVSDWANLFKIPYIVINKNHKKLENPLFFNFIYCKSFEEGKNTIKKVLSKSKKISLINKTMKNSIVNKEKFLKKFL